MHLEHKMGAVKMRTFDNSDEFCSAMLDFGQQLPGKDYAPKWCEHDFTKFTADQGAKRTFITFTKENMNISLYK